MERVLIVDDDRATVDVIRENIHWKELGIDRVFTAYNIEQAKRILLAESVSLVISDIEMPMGSGLDLLDWFRAQGQQGEFLLLTCHEDFSYASAALHNRAAEYLLKPLDVEVMEVALRRALQRIESERLMREASRYGRWMQANRNQVQLAFWEQVLDGRYEGRAERIAADLHERGLTLDPAAEYSLVISRVTGVENDRNRFRSDLLLFALRNIHSDILCRTPENDSVLSVDQGETIVVVTVLPAAVPDTLRARCEALLQSYGRVMTSVLTCCICDPCTIERMHGVKGEALRRIATDVARYGQCFTMSEAGFAPAQTEFEPDSVAIAAMLAESDKRGLLEYLKTTLQEQLRKNMLDAKTLHILRQSLLQAVYVELSQYEIRAADLFADAVGRELSEKATRSMLDFIRWANYLLTTALDCKVEYRQSGTLSYKVRQYIHDHYAEEIDRNQIAAALYLSPEYLGKVFKRETGQNLKDAIAEYRIERAKELLGHPELRVGDIAMQVGFDSFTYFSTQFKKYTGITPGEYRKNILQSGN